MHRVGPHYLWEQDYSAKGDETRDAPVYVSHQIKHSLQTKHLFHGH